MIYYIMGVSGCGKTTVGSKLAKALGLHFFDADHYHPKANVDKMSAGLPLNDQDRAGWLKRLHELACEHQNNGAVIACSALKEVYRDQLEHNLEVQWIFLQGDFETLKQRMDSRKDHFMPAALLKSQFETLEPPTQALTLNIMETPEELVQKILNTLKGN